MARPARRPPRRSSCRAPLPGPLQEVPRYDEVLDLRRTLVDSQRPDGAVQPVDWVRCEHASASQDLHGIVHDPLGGLGRECFGHRRFEGHPVGAAVLLPGRAVGKKAGGGEVRRHPRQLLLDQLELPQGVAELSASCGVRQGLLQRPRRHPARRAVVAIAAASEPASGSVIANAAMARPASTAGSQRSLSGAWPARRIGTVPRAWSANMASARGEAPARVSRTRHAARRSSSPIDANQPARPSRATRSRAWVRPAVSSAGSGSAAISRDAYAVIRAARATWDSVRKAETTVESGTVRRTWARALP